MAAVDDATHEGAMGAGCVAYLRKPFTAKLLIGQAVDPRDQQDHRIRAPI
jgi:hypothetical protein